MTRYSSESARVEVLSVEDLVKYDVEFVVATLDCVRRTIRLV
jgi:DMSO/TMAO reductase YedYZ molybdopterin-dependent catalytic subunit